MANRIPLARASSITPLRDIQEVGVEATAAPRGAQGATACPREEGMEAPHRAATGAPPRVAMEGALPREGTEGATVDPHSREAMGEVDMGYDGFTPL